MSAFVFPHNPEEMQQKILIYRLKWLVIFRIVLVTLLLGSALAINLLPAPRPLELPVRLSFFRMFLPRVRCIFLKRIRNIQLYAYFQIIYDLVVETGIIYITGGVESLFTFTYIFTIIAASILLLHDAEHLLRRLMALQSFMECSLIYSFIRFFPPTLPRHHSVYLSK